MLTRFFARRYLFSPKSRSVINVIAVDLINEEIITNQNRLNELQNNKQDKNYIENKINELKKMLDNCLTDDECFSDVFNELIDRIYVYKEENQKIKLDIYIKTGESINTFSDNLGRKFHLIDDYTTDNSRLCSH